MTAPIHYTNKLKANAVASFAFSFLAAYASLGVIRLQQLDREDYYRSHCDDHLSFGCTHFFWLVDNDIIVYAAGSAALAGVGIICLALNKKGNAERTILPMAAFTAMIITFLGAYYSTSQLHYFINSPLQIFITG